MSMKIRAIVFASLSIATSATLLSAQKEGETCKLLPGSQWSTVQRPTGDYKNFPEGACLGLYWPRVKPGFFLDLSENGATILIRPFKTQDDAKKAVAREQNDKVSVDAALGDGGIQAMEDPNSNDEAARTEEEFKSGEKEGETAETLMSRRGYLASFSCGSLAIFVDANPSKGPATRDLVRELDANLRSMGLCGSSGKPTVTRSAPPRTTTEEGTEAHNRVFSGETARPIREFASKNARYLVVIDRRWDPQQNCWVEERAFAGGIRGSDADRVSVAVGPSRSFCLNGSVYSAKQVNDTQVEIAKAREVEQKLDAYLRNHPNDADALNKKRQNQKWIEYYTNAIRAFERSLNGSIP